MYNNAYDPKEGADEETATETLAESNDSGEKGSDDNEDA